MSYRCTDKQQRTQNIHTSSARSHTSEEKNCTTKSQLKLQVKTNLAENQYYFLATARKPNKRTHKPATDRRTKFHEEFLRQYENGNFGEVQSSKIHIGNLPYNKVKRVCKMSHEI